MRTVDLWQQSVTVEELLNSAISDSVLILAPDGHEFILESVDEFEIEVAMLGSSEKFMQFLEKRSAESSTISLEEFEQTLI